MDRASPILVAIDFSRDSDAAAHWALEQARLQNLPLTFVHVVHEPADHPGFYHEDPKNVSRPMIDIAQEMLNAYLERMKEEHPGNEVLLRSEKIVLSGIPPTRIVEIAKKIKASQIIMGCRGLTGLPRLMLGSQAERVIHLSPVPVTILKNSDPLEVPENE